jgi:hypothetical protein
VGSFADDDIFLLVLNGLQAACQAADFALDGRNDVGCQKDQIVNGETTQQKTNHPLPHK